MLRIDQLQLSLPAGYGPRAEAIGRLVAAELGSQRFGRERRITSLAVPELTIEKGASDRVIARAIVAGIARATPAEPRSRS